MKFLSAKCPVWHLWVYSNPRNSHGELLCHNSTSEVTTLRRYTNLFIIIIIINTASAASFC